MASEHTYNSTQEIFSTQDLRSTAQDYKRAAEFKHKWELGQEWGPNRQLTAHARPVRRRPKYPCSNKTLGIVDAKTVARREIFAETTGLVSDSSCDEEVAEPSAAPDADVTYSFDAPRGPSHGSQILGHAITKAVELFENKQTDKLVKDEYEVLGSDGEPVVKSGKKRAKSAGAREELNEDEEYEFV